MRIQDIMSTHVVSVPPDTRIASAREELNLHRIEHLVVLRQKKLVGILSNSDLHDGGDDQPVSAVMTREVVTVQPDATIRQAAAIMDGHTIGCLPVVDGGRVTGIVTSSDFLRALAKGEVHVPPPSTTRHVLRKRGPRKHHPAF